MELMEARIAPLLASDESDGFDELAVCTMGTVKSAAAEAERRSFMFAVDVGVPVGLVSVWAAYRFVEWIYAMQSAVCTDLRTSIGVEKV